MKLIKKFMPVVLLSGLVIFSNVNAVPLALQDDAYIAHLKEQIQELRPDVMPLLEIRIAELEEHLPELLALFLTQNDEELDQELSDIPNVIEKMPVYKAEDEWYIVLDLSGRIRTLPAGIGEPCISRENDSEVFDSLHKICEKLVEKAYQQIQEEFGNDEKVANEDLPKIAIMSCSQPWDGHVD